MREWFVSKYIKSYKNRPDLLFFLLVVFIIVLFAGSEAFAVADVTLAWDPPDTWQPDGYKIYCKAGFSPSKSSYDRQIVIPRDNLADPDNPQYTVDNVSESETTFFAATAYEPDGDESGFSNVIHYTGSEVNQAPTASFTASPISGDLPLAVTFDASASTDPDGTIVSYSWDFGDGAAASGVTINHTFTWAGTYTVTLTVTDDGMPK